MLVRLPMLAHDISSEQLMQTTGKLILAASGNRCPATGDWQSLNSAQECVPLREGDAVPLQSGRPVYWVLRNGTSQPAAKR